MRCSVLSGVVLLSSWNGHKELQRDVSRAGEGSVRHQIMPATELCIKGKYCVLLSMVSFVHLRSGPVDWKVWSLFLVLPLTCNVTFGRLFEFVLVYFVLFSQCMDILLFTPSPNKQTKI